MFDMPRSPTVLNTSNSFASFNGSFANTSALTTGASFNPDGGSGTRRTSVYANATRSALSKEAADRALDKIISFFTSDTPRSAAQLKSWVRAKQIHAEVRSNLSEMGWKRDTRAESSDAPPTEMMAAKLFPAEWFDILNEELLADLIVDSFAGTISDAFVDGAILLYDADVQNAGRCVPSQASPRTMLASSSSEPSLRQRGSAVSRPLPALKTPLVTMPSHGDLRVRSEKKQSGGRRAGGCGAMAKTVTNIDAPREGFTQAGLPQNDREAWQRTHYHECKPLLDYRSRIHLTTEQQRPKRLVTRPPAQSMTTNVWPSTKWHFPDTWDTMTQKRRFVRPTGEIVEDSNPVITVSEEGKSVIPYSLVLHKAFLEAQPASLREKAKSIVPLKLTCSAADLE
jgi:hypothetical protein